MKKLYAGENAGMYHRSVVKTPDEITRLGMARTFQNIRLFKSMTVFENVLVATHMRRTSNLLSATFMLNRKEERAMRDEVAELLRIVGLEDEKDEAATSLPYGKQRKLEIARALATKPSLLLLDEPAAGMNPQETEELTCLHPPHTRRIRPYRVSYRTPHEPCYGYLRPHLRHRLRRRR